MIGVIVVIFGILAVTVNNFATARNLTNLLTQVAPIALMASGVTFVLITAGMDISCPSVMAASAVVGVYYMTQVPNASYVVGTLIVLLVGAFLGLINGFAIAKLKMVPLVVTLSMMTVGTGLATSSAELPAFLFWTDVLLRFSTRLRLSSCFCLWSLVLTLS